MASIAQEPITPTTPAFSRRRTSSLVLGGEKFPGQNEQRVVSHKPGPMSPPPTPKTPNNRLRTRLRNSSGLALIRNGDALKKYTDYHPDGTPKGPMFSPIVWQADATAGTGMGPVEADGPAKPLPPPPVKLPIADIFSPEVFRMVLNNPTTAHRLWKFAQTKGGGQDVEYLIRTQEITKTIGLLRSQMSAIPETFTSKNATTPLRMPQSTARTLNSNVQNITTSLLPGLDLIFQESKQHILQRVSRDIYPSFVKSQLALCTSMMLSSGASGGIMGAKGDYPGLGDAFCLTDPHRPDNPIVFVSDGFVSVTKYHRSDVVGRNCRFLQGGMTDRAVVGRIRKAILSCEESVEVLLNYRQDGTPFWNLLLVCPIYDASGKLRFCLGGQINVSDTIGSHKDILRILHSSPPEPALSGPSSIVSSPKQPSSPGEYDERPVSTKSHRHDGPKKSFFSFRKGTLGLSGSLRPSSASSNPSSHATLEPALGTSPDQASVAAIAAGGLEQTLAARSATEKSSLTTQMEAFRTAYSRYIILENDSPVGPASAVHADPGFRRKGAQQLKMVAFSPAALKVLGLGMAADAIANKDVFTVLAEQANSTSVTRAFKTVVRERVLRDGESLTTDLVVQRPADEKGVPAPEGGKKGAGGQGFRAERLVTYWTPLKDEDGCVMWVVLIVSPAA